MVLAAHSTGPFGRYSVCPAGSLVHGREHELREADDTSYRFGEVVGVRHGVEMGL